MACELCLSKAACTPHTRAHTHTHTRMCTHTCTQTFMEKGESSPPLEGVEREYDMT